MFGGLEDVGVDDLITQTSKLSIGEADMVERLELVAEVLLQCGLVADIRAVGVFELFELADQTLLDIAFFLGHATHSSV